jgi:hypothetical protein
VIQILGIRRVITLAILAMLSISLGAGIYFYFIPRNAELIRELQALTAQASQKRTDVENLRSQYQIIQEQKTRFENLTALGFFSNQNRAVARVRIEQIQKFTNVLTAKYNINAATMEKNQAAEEAGYTMLDSPVTVNLEALDDIDVYNFIYWVVNAFPGHVSISNIKIEREMDVNDATLRQIGNGIPTVLVKATVGFDWRTMVPTSEIPAPPEAPKG